MPGLKEIAQVAGVSIRTVKRALSQTGPVSEETGRRVRAAARRLEYRPNLAARSLKTGASSEIVVLMHSTDELHMDKLLGIESVLRAAGFSVLVLFALSETEESHVAEAMLTRRPAGAILFPAPSNRLQSMLSLILKQKLPYVVLDTRLEGVNAVRIDRAQGVEEAVRHLAAQGRRHIAYVGPIADRSRLAGYERALAAFGMPSIVAETPAGSSGANEIENAVRHLMRATPSPDAMQAYSDTLAMTLLRTLHALGARIPDEVAVVGFDNRAFASLAHPPLTTVAQPGRDIGEAAGTLLLRQIAGEKPPAQGWTVTLSTRLIARESA